MPNPNQNFDRFIEPARAYPQLWRLALGLLVGTAIYLGFTFGVIVLAASNGLDFAAALNGRGTPMATSALLLSFLGMSLGVLVAVRLFHRRDLQSLLGPDLGDVWRNFLFALIITLVLSIVIQAGFLLYETPVPNLPFSVWLLWVPSSLVLILIQTSAEELVFRGYIQQQLAARFRSPWIWWLLPSLAFGMLHYDPEAFGSNAWLVVADTALFGLVVADITARTGNLGAAIGIHFVNNAMAFLFIAPIDDMNGLSLHVSLISVSDIEPMRFALLADFGLILFAWLVYRRIMRQRNLG